MREKTHLYLLLKLEGRERERWEGISKINRKLYNSAINKKK